MNAKPVVLVGIWWLGLTGAIMLAGTAPTPVCYAAEPAIAAARTTNWRSIALPPDPAVRVVHPTSGSIADQPRTSNGAGYAALDGGGVLWITSGFNAYYWDGEDFRKPQGADLDFRSYTQTIFGGNDRELYASQNSAFSVISRSEPGSAKDPHAGQRSGEKEHEGTICRLRDGRAEPVSGFCYDYGHENPGVYVTKSGLLLNWCEKFIAVCIKGRWVRTEASLSARDTRVVEVGDRVCLLYSNRLYVVAGDGKVTAHSNYLDDPAIAVNNTPGKSVETTVPSTPDAVAWGTDRLLLLTPHLAGYDLATGKPINVEPIQARVHPNNFAQLFSDGQGTVWIRVEEGPKPTESVFYRVTPEGEVRREAGTSSFAARAVYRRGNPLKASDGSLWFVLAQGGVARYRDGRAEIMGPGSGILGPVGTLLEGRKGEIFATTAYGLFVYDPKRPPAPPPYGADRWDEYDLASPVSPIRDSEGNLWMMLRDRPGEISCWDGHAWRHQKVPFDTSKIEFAMADDRGHVLLGEREIQYNVSPDGVAKYTDFKQALVAAIARGARRFDPECVAVNDGKELYLHFPYQEIQHYDGKQWHRLNVKKRFCLLESAQYGALIRTEWNEYYACERGQIRRVDVPADSTRWLWSGSGCQPYEAALLAVHPREYLPIEGGRASDPWLLRQPVGPASANPSERRAARAAFLRDVRVFSGNGSPDGWLSQGYSEGHWAAGNSGPTLYRIFAEQVINCRLDQGPLTGHGYFTPQILEDRAHNLWFDILFSPQGILQASGGLRAAGTGGRGGSGRAGNARRSSRPGVAGGAALAAILAE